MSKPKGFFLVFFLLMASFFSGCDFFFPDPLIGTWINSQTDTTTGDISYAEITFSKEGIISGERYKTNSSGTIIEARSELYQSTTYTNKDKVITINTSPTATLWYYEISGNKLTVRIGSISTDPIVFTKQE